MQYTLEIVPAANSELREISRWYDKQRFGLGVDFLLCAEEALDVIRRNPQAYQKVTATVARKLMMRFPYGIFFRLRNEIIEVIAVMHNHRDPVSWRKRI